MLRLVSAVVTAWAGAALLWAAPAGAAAQRQGYSGDVVHGIAHRVDAHHAPARPANAHPANTHPTNTQAANTRPTKAHRPKAELAGHHPAAGAASSGAVALTEPLVPAGPHPPQAGPGTVAREPSTLAMNDPAAGLADGPRNGLAPDLLEPLQRLGDEIGKVPGFSLFAGPLGWLFTGLLLLAAAMISSAFAVGRRRTSDNSVV